MSQQRWYWKWVMMVGCIIMSYASFGQMDPTDSLPGDPGSFSVYSVQDMQFGAFSKGASGGTITVSNAGVKTATGSVVALNLKPHHEAIFEVDAPPGTTITVTPYNGTVLTGSNGGSMNLTLSAPSTGYTFITTAQQPARTTVKIGGTLTVGNTGASPPGKYEGTFYVDFEQQ